MFKSETRLQSVNLSGKGLPQAQKRQNTEDGQPNIFERANNISPTTIKRVVVQAVVLHTLIDSIKKQVNACTERGK